ncbi:hypothetical protein, partial [Xanthomonas oryzae]
TTGREKAPSESDGKRRDIGVSVAWAASHLGAVPLEVPMEDEFWVVSTGGAIFVAPHESARRAEHHFCQRTYARSLHCNVQRIRGGPKGALVFVRQ